MNFQRSQELLSRAYNLIPAASQTFSKGPTQWPRGVSPHYLSSGSGAWVWDVDGNKYLDHLMALGAIILGYGQEEVNNAIKKQIDQGVVFSQMHPCEVDLAERLVDIIPSAEMVKFFKNGSDATTAAVRAARAYTGREYIAYCGYHGWHDWHIAHSTRDAGIPEFNKKITFSFVYNNVQSFKSLIDQHSGKIAAVIMEPVGVELPEPGFLESIRELCTQNGIVLIFDEIVTGFRLDIGGFQSQCGVIPDMSCFGKAMANGMPLSALVGHQDIMKLFDTHLFVSGTFGGEAASIAASIATIDILIRDQGLNKIKTYSEALCGKLRVIIEQYNMQNHLKILGFPQRSVLSFSNSEQYTSEEQKTYFMQESIKQNLLYFCSHVPCVAHGEEELAFAISGLEKVVANYSEVIQKGILLENLDAQVIEPVFRRP